MLKSRKFYKDRTSYFRPRSPAREPLVQVGVGHSPHQQKYTVELTSLNGSGTTQPLVSRTDVLIDDCHRTATGNRHSSSLIGYWNRELSNFADVWKRWTVVGCWLNGNVTEGKRFWRLFPVFTKFPKCYSPTMGAVRCAPLFSDSRDKLCNDHHIFLFRFRNIFVHTASGPPHILEQNCAHYSNQTLRFVFKFNYERWKREYHRNLRWKAAICVTGNKATAYFLSALKDVDERVFVRLAYRP